MKLISDSVKEIGWQGLWKNNVVLSQNLALCPLVAVTGTATNGLGMGLATLVVLVLSNMVISLNRNVIASEVRIPIFVLLIRFGQIFGIVFGLVKGLDQ